MSLERLDYQTNFEQGLIAARRAVSLAPDLGMAHTSLGFGLWNVGQWSSAEQEFELAIELSPGHATAHHWYGLFLWTTGRAPEGVAPSGRALELDPVSPIIAQNLGWALWSARRIDEAVEQYRETIQLAPGWFSGWYYLALASLQLGEYEEGLEAWVNTGRLTNADADVVRDAYEAMIRYRETGEPQTFPDFSTSPGALLLLYDQTGQTERAIGLLDDYFAAQGVYGVVASVHVRDASDALRDDPRYQALLAQAGITW